MAITINEKSTKQERQRAWSEIKEKSPDMADVISDINRVFGKPRAIDIQFKGAK